MRRKSRCEICKYREQFKDIDNIFYKEDGRSKSKKIEEILDLIEQVSKHRYNTTTLYKCFKNHKTNEELERKKEIEEKIDSIEEVTDKEIDDVLKKNIKLNQLVYEKLKDLILDNQLKPTDLSIIFQNTSRNIDAFKNTIQKLNKSEDKENTNININITEDISKVKLFSDAEFKNLDTLYVENKNTYKDNK